MSGSAIVGALRVVLGLESAGFTNGLTDAQVRLRAFDAKAKSWGAGIAKLGAGLSVAGAGLAAAIRGQLNVADDMSKAASKFGVPIETLSRLNYAADLSGVSTDDLGKSLARLSKGMADAAKGGAAAKTFDGLGISVKDASGKLRSADDVMADLSDRFADMPDGAEKTALAMKLFGKAGADMIPMLNMGADEMRRMGLEAEAMGLVIDAKTGKAAEAFNDNLSRLKGTLTGIATQIMASLAPTMEWLSQKAVEMSQAFQNLSPITQKIIAGFAGLVIVGGPLLIGLGAVVSSLGLVAGAFVALGTVVMAHPVIATITAIAAGAALIYQNWEPISAWFSAKWASINASASAAWDSIKSVALNPIEAIKAGWDMLPSWFTDWAGPIVEVHRKMFDSVIGISRDAFTAVTDWWNGIAPEFSAKLATLPQVFSTAWENIKAVTAGWVSEFTAIGGYIVDGLKAGIQAKWDAMVAWFEGLSNGMIASIKGVFDEHSPSRVFMEIGRFITEGLGLGIKAGAPMATGALQGVANDLLAVGGASGGGAFGGLMSVMRDLGVATDNIFGRMGGWFVDLAKGATTLRSTISSMLDGIAQKQKQLAFTEVGNFLTGSLGKVGGGLLSGVLGGLLGFANGGSFDVGGVGGIDSQVVAFRASPNERVSITKPGQEFAGMGGNMGFGAIEIILRSEPGVVAEIARNEAGAVIRQERPQIVQDAVRGSAMASRATKGAMGIR